MAWVRERETKDLYTIGELRAAIADLPEDMSVGDAFDGGLVLQIYCDSETGDREATIR